MERHMVKHLILTGIVMAALAFTALDADSECPLPLPPKICGIITTYIADVDAACSEFPDNDKRRYRALEEVKDKFFQDIKTMLVYPCDEHFNHLIYTASKYNSWSNKILSGMQIEYWRSQTDTIASWQSERKKALDNLKSFCSESNKLP
jgi:hypothetical protein